jgi:hypothetical protein
MNAGNIHNPRTGASRVYRYLLERAEQWVGGRTLDIEADVTAMSTRVSEVRKQLEREQSEWRIEKLRDGQKFFYRITKEAA